MTQLTEHAKVNLKTFPYDSASGEPESLQGPFRGKPVRAVCNRWRITRYGSNARKRIWAWVRMSLPPRPWFQARLYLDSPNIRRRRVGVEQLVISVKADQGAEGREIHLTLGHPAGSQFAQRLAHCCDGDR